MVVAEEEGAVAGEDIRTDLDEMFAVKAETLDLDQRSGKLQQH